MEDTNSKGSTVSTGQQKGLSCGRNWTAVTNEEQLLEFSVEPSEGIIQGPLVLEFLRGQRVFMNLQPGQLALLAQSEDLRAIYLDGGHNLEIGNLINQIDPAHRVILLAAERPIKLSWSKSNQIALPSSRTVGVIGNCQLKIVGPARFFRSFLADGAINSEDEFIPQMSTAVSDSIIDILNVGSSYAADSSVEVQSRVMRMQKEDLTDELIHFGLECTGLALYTTSPPVESVPVDTAGQLHGIGHN